MFKNHLKIAFRHLRKYKAYSFINITGLAIGMAACILILLYVQDELSFDNFHKNSDNIYRLTREVSYVGSPNHVERRANSGAPAGKLLSENFPDIKDIVQLYQTEGLVDYKNNFFYEEKFFFVSSGFFNVFSFPLIKGNPAVALKEPFAVTITEKAAKKYFGNTDPVNKTLTFENKYDFKVTGVIQDPPENSHFSFDFIASFESLNTIMSPRFFTDAWDARVWTYVLLDKNRSTGDLEQRFSDLIMQHVDRGSYASVKIHLQPLTNIHLHSHYGAEIEKNGDITTLYIFSTIALFILIIACINFMNLATARSANRALEVGIRKVVGAQRKNIIRQFFGESIFLSIISLVIAVVLVEIFLPTFNNLAQKDLSVSYGTGFKLPFLMVLLAFLVGIISGSYPALFLSVFKPVQVMKKVMNVSSSGSIMRKILVVAQFGISIILIISTLIIYNQLDYMRNRDIGFEKENIITIPLRYNRPLLEKYPVIKSEFLKNPHVSGVTASSNKPGVTDANGILMKLEGAEKEQLQSIVYIDYDYVETLGLSLTEGNKFLPDEKNVFYVNEPFLTRNEIESAVGRNIELYYRDQKNPDKILPMFSGKIKGTLKNFNCRSVERQAGSLVFAVAPYRLNYITIKINPGDIAEQIKSIRQTWQQVVPDRPFEFTFLDEDIDTIFKSEERLGKIFRYFTFLAIIVTSLGLFGLSAFMTEKRTKEIGIRKVLGATTPGIITLMSFEFLKLVFIANVIAWPLAYFVMRNWLQNFSYRITIGVSVFIISALLAVIIALFTVSFQAIKAAVTNPVNTLKYE